MSYRPSAAYFSKRSSMLSVEIPENEQLLTGRSTSCVEPYVTPKSMSRKSQTLGRLFSSKGQTMGRLVSSEGQTMGRLLSSEGLDLGLPGVYHFKGEDDDILEQRRKEVQMRKKPGRRRFHGVTTSMVEFNKSSVIAEEPWKNNSVKGDNPPKSLLTNDVSLSAIPPKKPPRTKLKDIDRLEKVKEQVKSAEYPSESPMHVEVEKHGTNTPDVKMAVQKNPDELKNYDLCSVPVKPRRRLKEKLKNSPTEDLGRELFNGKSTRFKISSKEVPKRQTREELKATLSTPFDFRKISPGKMPETQPIDLLQPHWSKPETKAKEAQASLPDLPSMEYVIGLDDSVLSMSAIQGPDILSHLNMARFQIQPVAVDKYHTMGPRNRLSTFSGFKRTWFSKHFSRKKHNKGSLYQPLLWNQVEPLDQGLRVRKDSRGSTEDESMDNNHLDVKDNKKKKEKDKRKDKDKKGKPPSRHCSDAKQSDKVRNKLRKFIGKRPTVESLHERGLIKETVFDCPLHKLCEKEGSDVPNFVRLCVDEVEKRGLNIDGIYRVSGNLSHVQKLRYLVDQEIQFNLGDCEWEDIHVITGALKMFLRELPEPVIPFMFFDKFIATCRITDQNSKHDVTKNLIRALPKPNKETLKYLLQHFCKVVGHSDCNRMQVQNIAIVFGPTLLLKPPEMSNHHDPGGGHMAVYMMYQNQIIDYMLTEFKSLF